MSRRTAARLGVALAVLLLAAGCVRIPSGGGVESAPIDVEGEGDELIVVPEGPVDGASPRDIVRGFILAGRGPQNGYQVAAEFLTDEFASRWQRGAGVLITQSAFDPVDAGDGTMSLEVEVAAELDAQGRYTVAGAPTARELSFALVQEDGEWRISDGPDGTILSPSSFDAIFEPAQLYFYSQDYRYLVPELRWFLDIRTIANFIVDELVTPESPLLASGALLTAFPPGTERRGTVVVDGGQAQVTLSSQVLASDGVTQSRMLEQLSWSLRSLGDIQSASIVAGGFPVSITGIGIDPLQVDAVPVGVLGDRFGTVGASGVAPVEGLGTVLDGAGARAVALGRDRVTAAVLTEEGAGLATAAGIELVDRRSGLAAPSLDPWDWVWAAPRDDPAGLLASRPGAAPIGLPIEEDGRIVALQLSRDGTRLMAALDAGSGSRVIVWGVVRDAELAPAALVDPVVVYDGAALADAAWADGTTIVVLSRTGTATVTAVRIGGRFTALGSVPDAVQLTVGNGVDGVRVLDGSGRIWRPGGEAGWLDTGWVASFLGDQQ